MFFGHTANSCGSFAPLYIPQLLKPIPVERRPIRAVVFQWCPKWSSSWPVYSSTCSNEGDHWGLRRQLPRKDGGFQARYRSIVLSSWVVYARTWPSPRSFWDRPSPYRGHFWCHYRVKTCRHPPFISTSRNSRPGPIQAQGRVVGGSESLARHRRVVCDDSTLCLDKICEGSIPTCRTPHTMRYQDNSG